MKHTQVSKRLEYVLLSLSFEHKMIKYIDINVLDVLFNTFLFLLNK